MRTVNYKMRIANFIFAFTIICTPHVSEISGMQELHGEFERTVCQS